MTTAPNTAETYAIRDLLLEQVGHYPHSAGELFSAFRHEWGSIVERRLWRALAWLESRGKIARVGDRYTTESGYVLSADGGAETEEDRRDRERIELREDGRCYGCKRRVALTHGWRGQTEGVGRFCGPCFRAMDNARRRVGGEQVAA